MKPSMGLALTVAPLISCQYTHAHTHTHAHADLTVEAGITNESTLLCSRLMQSWKFTMSNAISRMTHPLKANIIVLCNYNVSRPKNFTESRQHSIRSLLSAVRKETGATSMNARTNKNGSEETCLFLLLLFLLAFVILLRLSVSSF